MVPGEQQEQAVADRVERQRATLPEAQDVRVEDRPAQVVELEVALEPDPRRQLGGVERLDQVEMRALRSQLAEDGLTTSVAEEVVVLVQAHGGPEHRVVADQPHETGLDEVVEPVVERPAVRRRRRSREDPLTGRFGHGLSTSERWVVARG